MVDCIINRVMFHPLGVVVDAAHVAVFFLISRLTRMG